MSKFSLSWSRATTTMAMTLLIAAQPVGAREAQPVSQTAIKSMDAAVANMVAERKAAGYVVALARGDRIFFLKSYGLADIEKNVAMTPDTVFRVGSITKQFTAAGILLLADLGKISVEDRLSKYLPDYPNADKITIYQLLTHTSGLANFTGVELFRSTMRLEGTTSDMVTALAGISPQFEFNPGEAWSYSNTGYYLLGGVIEKVSGQTYSDYMRTNVFMPLGLKDTAIDDHGEIVPHRASGYVTNADAPTGFRNASWTSLTVAGGAGAARTTIRDLIAWNAALLGGKLLKPETLALMTSPAKLSDGRSASAGWLPKHQPLPHADYGMGVGLGDDKGRAMVGHGGAINGFNAALFTYRDRGVTIAILANTGSATYQFAPRMADIILSGATEPSASKVDSASRLGAR